MPANANILEMKKYITEKFNCSKSHFYKIVRMYNNPFGSDFTSEHLKHILNENGFYSYFSKDTGIPEVMLIITPQMRDLYNKYGFMIKIDFTFKLIREEVPSVDHEGTPILKKFAVGFISGVNPNNKIIIYALCLSLQETKANTKLILGQFF